MENKTSTRSKMAAAPAARLYQVIPDNAWARAVRPVTCLAPSMSGALCVAEAEHPGVIWAYVGTVAP